jgi:hypothetical protein
MATGLLGDYEIRQEAATVDPLFHDRLGRVLAFSWPRTALFARVRAVQAVVTPFTESEETRMGWFLEARQIVPTGGDPHARMAILQAASRMDFLNKMSRPELLLPLADEFVALAVSLGSIDAMVHASSWRASALLTLGRGQDFASEVSLLERCALRARHPQFSYFPRLLEGTVAFLKGDLAGAERLARAAPELGKSSVGVLVHALAAVQLLTIGMEKEQGERESLLSESLEHANAVLAVAPSFDVMLVVVSSLRAHLGDHAAAAQALSGWQKRWSTGAFKDDSHTLYILGLLSDLASHSADRVAGAELYRALLPHSHLHVTGSVAISYCAPVSYWLGRLASALGRPDVSVHFEHAIIEAERACSRSWKAWAELGLAQALEAGGGSEDRSRADAARASALRTAEQLGLPRLGRAARGEVDF